MWLADVSGCVDLVDARTIALAVVREWRSEYEQGDELAGVFLTLAISDLRDVEEAESLADLELNKLEQSKQVQRDADLEVLYGRELIDPVETPR